ncbi:RagB/SusD family nutrient uptake outer membrane protein [Aurantibacter aestuarii]|uniref:RagB/SusD family nutrient uptake outer membrane protein n=1 Tax=Aurantibacter aestuarii TaxID=1266046 RepID=A0A2T1NC56_9FLAO|nr:RagB/SusD family nutrient uptake outer membrane protein [Aurantibacter aestuarii]PSG90028.1 RagB/SusD family nutrient uptake outer membrane protein [Aurantibacter aestuarii]
MKTEINFFKTYALVTLLAFVLVQSCSEDFIDVDANQETEDALTPDRAPELVNAVYNSLLKWEMSSFGWTGLTSIASDDADKGSIPSDTGADKNLLDGLQITPTIISVSEVWQGHYNGIQRANQAISRISEFDMDVALQTRLLGEARFLRALFYFRLVQSFGGVPLISNITSVDDINSGILAKKSKEECFAFIEQDLLFAIDALPLKSEYPASELGRATKGAAQTLMAKVSMYQSKWPEVVAYTDAVILSLEYDLTPNYEDIWKETSENNIESIFEIQARGNEPAAGVDKYSTIQGARGEGGWGWGFNTPSQDLNDAYTANDLRREATIMYAGETLFDGRVININAPNPRYNQKAYSSILTESEQTGKNVRLFRFAEVLLMNAEAKSIIGGDVATPLNKVRLRAGLTAATDLSTLAIWEERRLELAFEHDRYFDLVRQGRASMVLNSKGIPFMEGKHEVFPIPQEQIDISAGALVQNPNY